MDREHLHPDRKDETADLGQHIVARYGRSPGVIPMDATLQSFRRTAQFGHDRLPLLTRLSRYWEGMNHPYPGSGGPLTFLQPSPFASVPAGAAEWVGRSAGSATTETLVPRAPSSIPVVPRGPLPRARETEPRTVAESTLAPSTLAAPSPGSAIVRRRRSLPEVPSPRPDTAPAAPRPAEAAAATVAAVVAGTRPTDGSLPTSPPLSPKDGGLGRPIIRRRKRRSAEASPETPAAVTTGIGPRLRAARKSQTMARTIERGAAPMAPPRPVAGENPPSTIVSAPASPERPIGADDLPSPEPTAREEPTAIQTQDTEPHRGDLGTTITSKYANTTMAANPKPLPESMGLPRQNRSPQLGPSEETIRAVAENRPKRSTVTIRETITLPSPTTAQPISEPPAATARNPGKPPTHPAIVRAPTDAARPRLLAPSEGMGSSDVLSPARLPMPLAVQRDPQRFSAETAPKERFPTTAWQSGNAGRSPFAIGGHRTPTEHGSGAATEVSINDLRVETEPTPSPSGDGRRPDVDELADKVLRRLMRQLTDERERRGRQPWF